MDKIEKALKKFDEKEKAWIKDILLQLKSYSLKGLNIKKLKGHNNIFASAEVILGLFIGWMKIRRFIF